MTWFVRAAGVRLGLVVTRGLYGVRVGGWYLTLRGPSMRPLYSERNRIGCDVWRLVAGWRIVLQGRRP